MSKQLRFTYEGKEYVLEYTRKSVETMERQGFVADDISTKPMLTLPALFRGAFLANHSTVPKEKIDKIYAMLTDKGNLIRSLAEMYNEPIAALVEDPEESEGNLNWTASW